MTRYSGSGFGAFLDLLPFGGQLYAITGKGVCRSTTAGRTWLVRCASAVARSFVSLQDGGRELIAMTADGHIYASSTEGATWLRRR